MIFKEINYKKLHLNDNPKQNIAKFFVESIKFIHETVTSGKKILIHCLGGKSRSVTIVVAYVMLRQNKSFEEVLAFVKSVHRPANPNPGFIKQLKLFEKCVSEYYKQIGSASKEEFDYDLLEKLINEYILPILEEGKKQSDSHLKIVDKDDEHIQITSENAHQSESIIL